MVDSPRMADIYEVPKTTSTKKKFTISNKLISILLVVFIVISLIGMILGVYALSRSITEPSSTALKEKMNKIIDDNEDLNKKNEDLSKRVDAIEDLNAEAVGFYAVASKHTTLQLGSILIFDKIITNHGNAYSGISGTFTAPVHGLYQFTLHYITGSPFPDVNLAILLNDIVQCKAYGRSGSYETGTCSTLLELMPGDLINVKLFLDSANDGGVVYEGYPGLMGYLYKPL